MQTQTQKSAPEKVHSQMVRAGRKNYFFDVKKAGNDSNYLTITESYLKPSGEKVINRLMIFGNHFPEFAEALAEANKFIK
jgi:hypothetical protein